MPTTKLTNKFVADQPPTNKLLVFWDTEVSGLSLRVYPTGRKVFYFRCRSKLDGVHKIHEPKIGEISCISVSAARNIARNWHSKIRLGIEPEFMQRPNQKTIMMSELFEIYLTQYATKRKKASSLRHDERMIKKHLTPHFGRTSVKRITRSMIRNYHLSLTGKPYEANRRLALLSKVFSFAAEELLILNHEDNPAKGIRKFTEKKRRRYLSSDELQRLGYSLKCAESGKLPRSFSKYSIATIRLLLLTGARQGEILSLKWSEVNFQRSCLELKDSKTGAKDIYLPEGAVEILNQLPKVNDNPYVMVGSIKGKPLVNLKDTWRAICEHSNLVDVRLHDLRHTYASIAVQSGISLPIIGAILGHKSTLTTSRYAHLNNAPAFEAGATIGKMINSHIT